MNFNVRRARREDSEDIGRMHVASIRELCGGHYGAGEIEAWARPREAEFYVKAIERKEFYVAEEGAEVIGFGTLNQTNGEVEAVYVHPAAVGRGVGSKLLNTLEERAREGGLKSLHLCASLNAVEFYERAGFVRLRDTSHRLANGIEIACVLMSKELWEEIVG
ncbi:MAG TPA: GNAT family N-acetyltransferase [Pyrinomonadaceae bacterium]|nr:GNAT family N-acetyltransferase [Pyrinomonadaceae bacterium]